MAFIVLMIFAVNHHIHVVYDWPHSCDVVYPLHNSRCRIRIFRFFSVSSRIWHRARSLLYGPVTLCVWRLMLNPMAEQIFMPFKCWNFGNKYEGKPGKKIFPLSTARHRSGVRVPHWILIGRTPLEAKYWGLIGPFLQPRARDRRQRRGPTWRTF